MTTNERRPRPAGPRATRNNNNVPPQDTPSGIPATTDTRHRCTYCGHPTRDPLSIARGFGPTCWRRLERAQLDDRRETVGRHLRAVAALVARADAPGLSLVVAALVDLLDALEDDEGVAR